MRQGSWRQLAVLLTVVMLIGTILVIRDRGRVPAVDPNGPIPGAKDPAADPDSIPPKRRDRVIAAHDRAVGHMERYEYGEAIADFRRVRDLAPGWRPGAINLAISLLNYSGTLSGDEQTAGFQEAITLLDSVLRRDPNDPFAHYCRGLIFETRGDLDEAHREFRAVTDTDPRDADAWYHLGSTLTDPDKPRFPAGPKQAKELIGSYTKALEQNPYHVPALFKLQAAYRMAGAAAKQKETYDLWQRLNPKGRSLGPGDSADTVYGEMGRYATVIGPPPEPDPASAKFLPPRFDPPVPLKVSLPDGHRWAKSSDFSGRWAVHGRARARFGQAVATFDADGDGKLDVLLAASVVGPKGLRDALLLNRGEGRFEDATATFGLPDDRASLGIAAGDFDADRRIDLVLTGVGDNRLYRNLGDRFEDVSPSAGLAGSRAISPTARWLDLDQDGDLDLYILNHVAVDQSDSAFSDKAGEGMPNSAYRNDGKPASSGEPSAVAVNPPSKLSGLSIAMTPWPDAPDLLGGTHPHVAIAALDADGDRDIDLVLSDSDGRRVAVLNDRLGRFHAAELRVGTDVSSPGDPTLGLLSLPLDADDLPDLLALGASATPWRNRGEVRDSIPEALRFDPLPTEARRWRTATLADLDLDGRPDVLGLPTTGPPIPSWGRFEGGGMVAGPLDLRDPGGSPLEALVLADLVGDPLPDLVLVRDGEAPLLAKNLGNGRHWLSIDLGGRWRAGTNDRMRTNPQAIGTRLVLEGPGLNVRYNHTTPQAGPAQSVGPVVLGLGSHATVPVIRLQWPDGILQAELDVPADLKIVLTEQNRRSSSCPVLFTWNGEKFTCVADFLGGGGLGYLVSPGQYGQPDRDEAVAIEPGQLRAADGVYRLAVAEPMDEVGYLDQLILEVVDRPPGVSVAPDERFAPGGHRPTGELIAWRTAISPRRAADLAGTDLTEILRDRDGRTADGFRCLPYWFGYAEEHGIVLDFGDSLARFGPSDPLVLCLAGWVEYPYSQTNYAASTAGVALRPPVLERRGDDGTWHVLDADPGYPAGLPRLTTLDLTGKLTGPRCEIRLRTNMECYWDQAFVALRDRGAGARVTRAPLVRASLGFRGALREASPDGRPPLLYDHDRVDPTPFAGLAGRLTRYGDVAELLQEDDDRFCLVGPGDEARLDFDASMAPELPPGWTRSFVLRAAGYCKDADPFTATGDTIDPLPWRGMPSYPLGPEVRRPDTSARPVLDDSQTRPAHPADRSR